MKRVPLPITMFKLGEPPSDPALLAEYESSAIVAAAISRVAVMYSLEHAINGAMSGIITYAMTIEQHSDPPGFSKQVAKIMRDAADMLEKIVLPTPTDTKQ